MNILKSVVFASVAEATRQSGKPSASVRANGKIMFSDSANLLIGYDGKKEDRLYFKLGKDEAGIIYLVPATKADGNTLKAAKNNASFQFNDIKTIAALGMQPGTRYAVAELEEDGFKFYSLTLKTAAEKAAEDAANVKAHTEPVKPTDPTGDARIAAKVAEKAVAKPAPTKKELEAAAKKAAKADFKAAK
ncbi:MAG: hypothetical protein V4506_14455 [Bacteroidota bacterium]